MVFHVVPSYLVDSEIGGDYLRLVESPPERRIVARPRHQLQLTEAARRGPLEPCLAVNAALLDD